MHILVPYYKITFPWCHTLDFWAETFRHGHAVIQQSSYVGPLKEAKAETCELHFMIRFRKDEPNKQLYFSRIIKES